LPVRRSSSRRRSLGLLEVLLAGERSEQGVVQHVAGKVAAGLILLEPLQAAGDGVGKAFGLPAAGEKLPGDLDALLPAAPIDREGGIVEPGREHQHLPLGPIQLAALRDLLRVVDQRAAPLEAMIDERRSSVAVAEQIEYVAFGEPQDLRIVLAHARVLRG